MPAYEEVLAYLGIDYADDKIKQNVERSILTAEAYLKGSIGKDLPDDPRVKELALIFISDLYDNRGMIEKTAGNVRRLVDDMSLQLRLELSSSESEGV